MSFVLGKDNKLYRNTGTYGAPVWDEVPNIQNLRMDISTSEADVSTRGNAGWKATVGAQNDATVTFNMVYDTGDTDFSVLWNAILNKTTVELLIMDGDRSVAGKQGLRARWMLTSASMDQPLEAANMVDFTARPTYNTDATPYPAWVTGPL